MAQTGFPLPLRNALAELVIDALRVPDAVAALEWLRAPAGAPSAAAAERLAGEHLIEPGGTSLLAVHAGWDEAIGAHAARGLAAATAHRAANRPTGSGTERAVAEAAALWNARLFFEVHEVLEAEWGRTTGPLRTGLQGLIQIAVAFHHLRHGNLRGARNLFRDGRERVRQGADALPWVDVPALLAATARWDGATAELSSDDDPPPLPLRAA